MPEVGPSAKTGPVRPNRIIAAIGILHKPRINRSVAGVLRQHAQDTATERMVMDAYGHSRLRERLLGGVTKSMLDQSSVPILMAR